MKTTPPAKCHLIGEIASPGHLVARVAFVILSLGFAAVVHAGSCCKKTAPTPQPPACCASDNSPAHAATHGDARELPPTDFTRDSLYQLDAPFTTDAGTPFTLSELRGRPVIVAMFFASCNYACPLLVSDITRMRDALPSPLRDEVAIVLVTFDTERDTPAALKKYRDDRLLSAQWTLLHGDDDSVRELAALLGVKFKLESSGQFAHSNLITILDAEGEIVHQRAGLQGGLIEAAAAIVLAHEQP
jgi:protein SCO1